MEKKTHWFLTSVIWIKSDIHNPCLCFGSCSSWRNLWNTPFFFFLSTVSNECWIERAFIKAQWKEFFYKIKKAPRLNRLIKICVKIRFRFLRFIDELLKKRNVILRSVGCLNLLRLELLCVTSGARYWFPGSSHFDSWNRCQNDAAPCLLSTTGHLERDMSVPPDVELQLLPHSFAAMILWGVYLT